MSKVYDMQAQLKIGKNAESLFLSFYDDLVQLDGRKGDFIGRTGRVIELKADSRTVKQTPNIFVETVRDDRGNPGGPYQSLEHGAYYWVYLFACGTVYWFRTQELVDFIEEHKDTFEERRIQNKGWSAVGLLVPRTVLEPVIIRKERLYERTSE